jgi:hypothetical protein
VSPPKCPTHLISLSVCLSTLCLFCIPNIPQLNSVRFSNNQEWEKACSNKGLRENACSTYPKVTAEKEKKGKKFFIFLSFCWFVCLFFETQSYYVAKADLKLMILLPQSPKCWEYKCSPPHLESKFSWMNMYLFYNQKTEIFLIN